MYTGCFTQNQAARCVFPGKDITLKTYIVNKDDEIPLLIHLFTSVPPKEKQMFLMFVSTTAMETT